jgi:4-hydroxy-tetrahydrodipicolinate synthase
VPTSHNLSHDSSSSESGPSSFSGFTGLWIPLITPFRHAAVDHPALIRLVQHYRKAGVSGFVVCGSTGEAAALDDNEQLAVLDTVIQASDGLPVVMGVSGYNLQKTLAWTKTVTTRPLAGLLLPSPHYIRPSQAGVLQWFEAVAETSPAPLIVYDIPYRTGTTIDVSTLLQLAAHPNIRAVKDCGGDAAKTQALIADGRLKVLAGDDLQLFATIALGGTGAIAASAHLQTEEFVKVIELLEAGALLQARAVWMTLVPVIQAMFAQPNPTSIKAALAQQGWIENELRAPMIAA